MRKIALLTMGLLVALVVLATLVAADDETELGAIGDYVWLDNGEMVGLQEPDEVGLNDVDLELWMDLDGDSVFSETVDTEVATATTITNPLTQGGGWYHFGDLILGTYFVRVSLQEFDRNGTLWEYGPTVPDVGTDDTADSDGNNPTCPYSSTVGTGECGQIGFENNVLVAVTLSEVDGEVESATDIDFGVVAQEPPTAIGVSRFDESKGKKICPGGGAAILLPLMGFLWTVKRRKK